MTRWHLRTLIAAGLIAVATLAALAQQKAAPPPLDPLAPKTSAEGAAIAPLHTVTICTSDLQAYLHLYRDGLGMSVKGPVPLSARARAAVNTVWGMKSGERWTLYLLERPTVPDAARVRLLVFDSPGSAIRQTWDPREPAPFTLGFPTTALPPLDASLRALGFRSLAKMEQSRIPRPDGTSYGMQEAVFKGPDHVHAVTVSRLDGMPQLGGVDPVTGLGGPAYSAQVVVDSAAVIAFYCDLLGLELRSDREWKTGATSAIGLPEGTAFRFSLLYAPGAATGQLLIMDFRGLTAKPSGVAPRPPNRGLGMYTFPVRSLDATAAKLRAARAVIVAGPTALDSPDLGRHRVMTVLAPNGVLVELFERAPGARPGNGGLR